jgi:hypothetical protein
MLRLNDVAADMRAAFTERLCPLGFARKGMSFVRRRCSTAHDKVFLGVRGVGDGIFRAHVSVGIVSEPVERLYAGLLEIPGSTSGAVTFALNLGYVMPRKSYLAWRFGREHPAEPVTRGMVETTLQYGLPYLERYASWEAIYDEAARYCGDRAMRLPIIKYLMDRPGEAMVLLEAVLSNIETYGGAAEGYRKGAMNLIVLCQKAKDTVPGGEV